MKCRICKKEIEKGTICPKCIYQERWEREKPKIMDSLFPLRINEDITELSIEVVQEDIDAVIDARKGLFIYGKTGTGKTIYAASLLLEIIKKYKLEDHSTITGQYIGGSEFFQEIRDTFSMPSATSSDVLQKYEDADLLVFDEIGTEKPSDWVLQMLYLLINYRYEHRKPIIIVSNFGLKELRKRLQDDRIPSRITGMCKIKHFEGSDFRIKGEQNVYK